MYIRSIKKNEYLMAHAMVSCYLCTGYNTQIQLYNVYIIVPFTVRVFLEITVIIRRVCRCLSIPSNIV